MGIMRSIRRFEAETPKSIFSRFMIIRYFLSQKPVSRGEWAIMRYFLSDKWSSTSHFEVSSAISDIFYHLSRLHEELGQLCDIKYQIIDSTACPRQPCKKQRLVLTLRCSPIYALASTRTMTDSTSRRSEADASSSPLPLTAK